jgi:hypothetical protein
VQVNDTAEFKRYIRLLRGIASAVLVAGGAAVSVAAYYGWRYATGQ